MSKSRFVLDKFARLIEQGLLSYKDLSDEIINTDNAILNSIVKANVTPNNAEWASVSPK